MTDKEFQERFLLLVTKNMDKLSKARLTAVQILSENDIQFTFAFGKDVVEQYFKLFPGSKEATEKVLGRSL